MVFKSAIWKITYRVLLIVLTATAGVYLCLSQGSWLFLIIFGALLMVQAVELIQFNTRTNEKLTRFFDAIQYADFSSSFTADHKLGKSYFELNQSLNKVLREFKKARLEKEEQMLFLQIILRHIQTGIVSYDEKGKIGLINNAAKQLLRIPQLKDIGDLSKHSELLLQEVLKLKPGRGISLKIDTLIHLTIRSTEVKVGGKKWTILSLQDIHAELKQNELEAWQNLTKVLRHEIMNSIAPIASLANSLQTVLKEDIYEEQGELLIEKDGYDDLKMGLETIESRSKGLINFVQVYREYTSIPVPVLTSFPVANLIEDVLTLLREDLMHHRVEIETNLHPADLQLTADQEQIQMILINLIKNAKEALSLSPDKRISIQAGIGLDQYKYIQVADRGPGIPASSIEDIFVPFYTTKKEGNGIGLAISRQIMNLHKGSLTVQSVPNEATAFTMKFPL